MFVVLAALCLTESAAFAEAAPAALALFEPGASDPVLLLDDTAPTQLRYAAKDFTEDAREATGKQIVTLTTTSAHARVAIIVGVAGASSRLNALEREGRIDLAVLRGKSESFLIRTLPHPSPGIDDALLIIGSDANGAMYGLYEASERAFGTDPLKFWTDYVPPHQDRVLWSVGDVIEGPPSFAYRGMFINDEDCLIGWKGVDPTDMVIEDDVYAKILETICRLKGNLIAPAMYAHYMTPATRQMAHDRGLYYTASHLEVLLSNPQNYWKDFSQRKWGQAFDYSYTMNPDKLREFWQDSIDRNKQYRSIWPVGLKGITDFAFWVSDPHAPKTMPERAEVVNSALHDQMELLGRSVTAGEPIGTLTMREEVLDLYNTGRIKLPDNVILVWDDDGSKAKMRQLPQGETRNRAGGNGVYYHVAYCDNQWVQWVSPELIRDEFRGIVEAKADRYALFNVGDIRESVVSIKAAMEVVWNAEPWLKNSDEPLRFRERWAASHFGKDTATRVAKAYDTYYTLEYPCRATSVVEGMISHTTAMELNGAVWNPVSSLDWVTESKMPALLGWYAQTMEFGPFNVRLGKLSAGYLAEISAKWDALYAEVSEIAKLLPPERRSFFFDNLILHVQSSRLVNHWANDHLAGFAACREGKFLEAAKHFDAAAACMDTIVAEREKACHDKWANWFRGEYYNVWRTCAWTLKPEWQAKDGRQLAAVAREIAAGSQGQGLTMITPRDQQLTLKRGANSPVATGFDLLADALTDGTEIRLYALMRNVENDDEVEISLNGTKLPHTQLHSRHFRSVVSKDPVGGIAEFKLDKSMLKAGPNMIECAFNGGAKGGDGYAIEHLAVGVYKK